MVTIMNFYFSIFDQRNELLQAELNAVSLNCQEIVIVVRFCYRYSPQFDQDVDATTRVQSVAVDEEREYQDPPRHVNYNYHPIIDFFKPEASMLQSVQPQMATQPAPVQSSNAWKPMISP